MDAFAAWVRAKRLGRTVRRPGAALAFCAVAGAFDASLAIAATVHEHIVVPLREVATRRPLAAPTTIGGFTVPAGSVVSETRTARAFG